MSTNLDIARRYLKLLEGKPEREELAQFFAEDVFQEEFPNRLVQNGARRDLEALLDGNERGKHLMASQTYDIVNAIEQGDQIALEVKWSGTLAIQAGTLQPGDVMRAHFGVFLTFRDGKIIRQHNYDCFEPW